MLKLFFIGDIVGRPGREIVMGRLRGLRRERGIDFVVANGENAAAGAGITGAIARGLLDAGVDAITLGDHVWDQRGWDGEIGGFERVCRPANLPAACPGRDRVVLEAGGFKLGVVTVLGRHFVGLKGECPFAVAERVVGELKAGGVGGVFVEVHAEATSEKQALGWFLDGRALAVLGTHTHVATADAAVLPGGTAFMCDVGMTGPYASVLGREIAPVVARFRDGMPRKCGVAEGDARLSGALVTFDPATGRAVGCELVVVRG
jgi:metallophosphoesterase (TIGR00282 family)